MIGDRRPPCALTIAGSDSGGGAGIQADLKAFAAHGVHGLSAIAALTAQHTRGVVAVHVPPVSFLRAQIDACFDDFNIRAVKLGMLATAEVIGVVAEALHAHRPAAVIVDPVMVATSGAKLLEDISLQAMRSHVGDTLNLYRGCSKLLKSDNPVLPTCLSYGAVADFRGEPEVPGNRTFQRVSAPGASYA